MFDIILIIIILSFGFVGFWTGFIHTAGSFIGTIVGAVIASWVFEPISQWFINTFAWSPNITRVFVFIIIFSLVNRAVGLIFWFIEKMTKLLTLFPGMKTINRILGFFFGIAEGALTFGLILFFIQQFPFSETLTAWIDASWLVPGLQYLAGFITPFLPTIAI